MPLPEPKFAVKTIVRVLPIRQTGKVQAIFPLTTEGHVDWVYAVRLTSKGSFVGGEVVEYAEQYLREAKVVDKREPGRRQIDNVSEAALDLVLRLAKYDAKTNPELGLLFEAVLEADKIAKRCEAEPIRRQLRAQLVDEATGEPIGEEAD